MAKPRQ